MRAGILGGAYRDPLAPFLCNKSKKLLFSQPALRFLNSFILLLKHLSGFFSFSAKFLNSFILLLKRLSGFFAFAAKFLNNFILLLKRLSGFFSFSANFLNSFTLLLKRLFVFASFIDYFYDLSYCQAIHCSCKVGVGVVKHSPRLVV